MNFLKIARPLTQLTRKGVPFKWDKKYENSFQELKKKLIEPSILAIPKPSEKFIIYTDASHTSLGGVLIQEEKVVAYTSRQLKNHK
jgi:hypothetical protein